MKGRKLKICVAIYSNVLKSEKMGKKHEEGRKGEGRHTLQWQPNRKAQWLMKKKYHACGKKALKQASQKRRLLCVMCESGGQRSPQNAFPSQERRRGAEREGRKSCLGRLFLMSMTSPRKLCDLPPWGNLIAWAAVSQAGGVPPVSIPLTVTPLPLWLSLSGRNPFPVEEIPWGLWPSPMGRGGEEEAFSLVCWGKAGMKPIQRRRMGKCSQCEWWREGNVWEKTPVSQTIISIIILLVKMLLY